jgi:hypothetical protein
VKKIGWQAKAPAPHWRARVYVLGPAALHWPAGAGHWELTELLIANNADVNANGACRETPLHWRAVRFCVEGSANAD